LEGSFFVSAVSWNKECCYKFYRKYTKLIIQYKLQYTGSWKVCFSKQSTKTCIVLGWGVVGLQTANMTGSKDTKILMQITKFLHVTLTLSNPIFLPLAYSPALIYFGRERGWWITCNYPTVLEEKNRNRNSTTCTICWLKFVQHKEKRREQENHNIGGGPT
jgi:hypothetical protein